MTHSVVFKKPNGTVAKLTGCTKAEFLFNGTIVKVIDAVGDILYINTVNCLIYVGNGKDEDGESKNDTLCVAEVKRKETGGYD